MTYTQRETAELFVENARRRHELGWVMAFAKAFMGGVLLSLGGLFSLVLGGGLTDIGISNPGISKFLSALVFPIGLIMITLQVTSVMATSLMAVIRRKTPWWSYPWSLGIATLGNLAGSLWTAALLGHWSGVVSHPPYSTYIISFAHKKVVDASFSQILCRGIGCNLLVCIGVYQAYMATEVSGKILAIHLPIFTFVACSFDHVVANMFSIPLSMMLGGDISVGYYVWKSMIPSFIGNIMGATFLALPLVYFHLMEQSEHPSVFSASLSSTRRGSLDEGGKAGDV